MTDLSGLNVLLKATSKQIVEKLVNLAFISRNSSPDRCIESYVAILELDNKEEASQLLEALLECIQVSLATGSVEALAELFNTPEKGAVVNPKLKPLVGQIISNKLELWKESAALNRVSLPHLVDFDWAVHIQKASSEVASMQRPSIIVALNVEDQPTNINEMPNTRTVEFELSREALETVIDGLGKIRDQLSKMG
eukprot:CAMPEP_0184998538 /NCGR_PEP_ID=MMETSP1098-20130426/62647_1 /TAXON_ID=89044 /ORGANISM="Spumella elongata, Strain CCAP 955/1" /LENGTH=195 /DNA_ID=CAMNT_0027525371 /DNA_START=36 /DNA_END=623 /DNA_ORIENTATION=-